MPEEQTQKPAEKKPENTENLPEFIPAEENPKPVAATEPARPVIPPAASTSKLTADEIAILNAIDMEKEEMKVQKTPIPAENNAPQSPAPHTIENTQPPAAQSPAIAKPIIQTPAESQPEKKPFFSLPFVKKNISASPVEANPVEIKPVQAEKKPPFSLFAKKPEQTPIAEKPAEKKPLFSLFAKKNEEVAKAIETENKQPMEAFQVATDNWKKIIPVLILVGAFAIFLMLRNSFSYMTGYAVAGIPLVTTDYISILIMGLLAFLAIFGTEKLMNKMYKYM